MKRIMVLVGTRPEVVKMAPVVMELGRRTNEVECLLISTGQHREMLAQALASFGLVPDADLEVMRQGQDLAGLSARLLSGLDAAYLKYKPDVVLAQGDTTTVLAGALAAFYRRIPLGHVEAGLRTHDFNAPWPEEMNRVLSDRISQWCFAPTELSKRNLLAEGVPLERVFVTGNTVIDALLSIRERVRAKRPEVPAEVAAVAEKGRFILVTAHRRESFGEGFERMCRAMREVVERYPDVTLVYPVHLNPNVREPVMRILSAPSTGLRADLSKVEGSGRERIVLTEPLGYEAFVWLMDKAHFCLTDSGGVQEEAPSLGKPVLVMRDTTERPEGVDAGTARLVGTDVGRIVSECAKLLDDPAEYARRSKIANPYGDGRSARRIVDALLKGLA